MGEEEDLQRRVVRVLFKTKTKFKNPHRSNLETEGMQKSQSQRSVNKI